MLNQILAITLKDWKVLVRDRGGMVALFLMPIMFILVMSAAQQGMYEVADEDNPLQILVINEDEGELADEAIAALQTVEGIEAITTFGDAALTRADAEDLIVDNQYDVAVSFPADFSEKVLAAASDADAPQAEVLFIADPATSYQFLAPIRGSLEGFIREQAAYAQMPLRLASGFDTLAASVPPEQAQIFSQVGEMFLDEMQTDNGDAVEGNLGVRFEQV
ncbi:MAG TPA: ABC transporter permease, partial [Anaerolineales bacterium]|nr:ABC transporter permease [Anaerolineales bacterium]